MAVKKSAVTKAKKTSKNQSDTSKPNKPPVESDFQILKACTTKTVSGSSTLKYQIGADPSSDIHFRVISSSGSGYVNPIWHSLNDILAVLEAHPSDVPFSSAILAGGLKLKGHSNNNIGFLIAVLLQEQILASFEGEDKFKWRYNSASKFHEHAENLQSEKRPNKGT